MILNEVSYTKYVQRLAEMDNKELIDVYKQLAVMIINAVYIAIINPASSLYPSFSSNYGLIYDSRVVDPSFLP